MPGPLERVTSATGLDVPDDLAGLPPSLDVPDELLPFWPTSEDAVEQARMLELRKRHLPNYDRANGFPSPPPLTQDVIDRERFAHRLAKATEAKRQHDRRVAYKASELTASTCPVCEQPNVVPTQVLRSGLAAPAASARYELLALGSTLSCLRCRPLLEECDRQALADEQLEDGRVRGDLVNGYVERVLDHRG